MMKTIEWDESFAFGIKEIDNDHRTLIGYFNEFFTACFCSMGPAVIDATLIKLLEYAN